jgi:hypothetical protein
MNLKVLRRALERYSRMRNYRPYKQVLEAVSAHKDVWMTSQGAYVAWWRRRSGASLRITAYDGELVISSDLRDAAFERFPQEYLTGNRTSCRESSFSGELQVVIDGTLERKHLLIDALQREGIMNFTEGKEGEFFLSHELDDALERMEDYIRQRELSSYNQVILDTRDAVRTLFARHGLPLIRIWYHPRIDGKVIKAVFSTRHDVDRAIANMPKILRLEKNCHASSSVYVRVMHPFYTDAKIIKLDSQHQPAEIALHAEFARHSQLYGSDLAAGKASKAHLEKVIGRPVEGVSVHGGELMCNRQNDLKCIHDCGFLYSITGRGGCWLPYRLLTEDGQLERTYHLSTELSDIRIGCDSPKHYDQAFYEYVMRSLKDALEHNGVFVLLLHPEYFGLWSYLLDLEALFRLLRFVPTYLGRVLKLARTQEKINLPDDNRSREPPPATLNP